MINSLKMLFIRATQKPVFIIAIEKGDIKSSYGVIRPGFKTDCREILQQNGIGRGIVYAVRDQHGRNSLRFSGAISKAAAQQLRNVWGNA